MILCRRVLQSTVYQGEGVVAQTISYGTIVCAV